MGFTLYVYASDGDYVQYGKEREVYLNHADVVAMLKFILDKSEFGKTVTIRRFDLHENDERFLKKDCSKEYHEYAIEELNQP
jgi:hypothetical protein